MKTSGIFLVISLFVSIIFSCKNSESGGKQASAIKDSLASKKVAVNGVFPDTPITVAINNPAVASNNKYSHYDVILKKDLCNKFWKIDGGINGNSNLKPDETDGIWYEFTENGKYTKSKYSTVLSSGTYTMDHQGMMEMLPSKSTEKKMEYQVKFNNDLMIFIGTPKYNDSYLQMRLSRIFTKPKKG